ncbi:alpha-monoglucosyldiacylglycerol synthase [Clostridiales bacterium]|nr:alpha-monoglucosyldiacylglycerol synthase [Clostridiales bacterium]
MKERLNVCLMNDSFPPTIDGVANTVFNYAFVIQNKLGNSIVATPKYPDVTDNYDFEVVRYASIDTTNIIGYRAGYPFFPSVIGELGSKNIDIIHSHCPAMSTVLARTLRENIDVPIVFTYHTKFDIDIKKAIKSNLIQEGAIRGIVNNIEACDEVWVVSRGAGENLKSLGYRGEYVVMENGVDFPKGKSDKGEVEKLRQSCGIEKNCPIFLFVGRMMWYKGLKITLDALKIISDAGLNFKMIIVGDGSDAIDIENYSKELGIYDDCIFTGAIQDREELRCYYTLADMFLFPSSYDTNGIVVREAAACGLGSVLIRGSCAAEGIEHRHNGCLIEENAESMAECLEELIDNIGFAHEIGNNAMNEIYISWEESVKKAYDRYKIVIEKYQSNDYIRKTSFTDDALSGIAAMCDSINRARRFRETVTAGFIGRNPLRPVEYFDEGDDSSSESTFASLRNGIVERTSEIKNGFREKRTEIKERFWHHVDRYL